MPALAVWLLLQLLSPLLALLLCKVKREGRRREEEVWKGGRREGGNKGRREGANKGKREGERLSEDIR